MKNIKRLPKYMPGQVIDLSYKNGGLPNRIYIKTVYHREFDGSWQYAVVMENTGTRAEMEESFVSARECHTVLPVYKLQRTKNRYSDGWRFCGNYDKSGAESQAKLIAEHSNIKTVVLFNAIAPDGKLLKDQFGIWIKYYNTIDNDGNVMIDNFDEVIKVIK